MAYYGKPNQRWVFYEIDPVVAELVVPDHGVLSRARSVILSGPSIGEGETIVDAVRVSGGEVRNLEGRGEVKV